MTVRKSWLSSCHNIIMNLLYLLCTWIFRIFLRFTTDCYIMLSSWILIRGQYHIQSFYCINFISAVQCVIKIRLIWKNDYKGDVIIFMLWQEAVYKLTQVLSVLDPVIILYETHQKWPVTLYFSSQGLLGCYAIWCCSGIPAFQRTLLPPSSRQSEWYWEKGYR
jgi:hypothetical protein